MQPNYISTTINPLFHKNWRFHSNKKTITKQSENELLKIMVTVMKIFTNPTRNNLIYIFWYSRIACISNFKNVNKMFEFLQISAQINKFQIKTLCTESETCGTQFFRRRQQFFWTWGTQFLRTCSTQIFQTCGTQFFQTWGTQFFQTCGTQFFQTCGTQFFQNCGNQFFRNCGNQFFRTCRTKFFRPYGLCSSELTAQSSSDLMDSVLPNLQHKVLPTLWTRFSRTCSTKFFRRLHKWHNTQPCFNCCAVKAKKKTCKGQGQNTPHEGSRYIDSYD